MVGLALLAGACEDGPPGGPALDLSVEDRGPADTGAPAPDGAVRDAAAVEAGPPDAERPDAAPLDAGRPDADPTDAAAPDLAPPVDAAGPDTGSPPDACAPECAPNACGEDGCGGQCGPCPAEAPACDAGRCVAPPAVEIREVFAVGDGPDWIELYNASGAAVDLAGWALSDDPNDPQAWVFPARVLEPGGRLVVYATGEDQRAPGEPLQADFRIASGGEFIGLAWRDGLTWVDTVQVPAQRVDLSYGVREAVRRTVLLGEGSAARWRAPAAGDWQAVDHPDADWAPGVLGLGFAGEAVPPDDPDLPNVALGRPTRHTSQLGDFGPDRAVNGDFGDFTHTDREDLAPEWAVALDGSPFVARVVLHNRQSCCGTRLRDITVSLHDLAGERVWASPLLNPEDALGAPATLEVAPGVVAHEVRVRRTPDPDLSGTGGAGNADEPTVLSLGEVEVFAGEGGVGPAVATDVGEVARGLGGIQVRVPFQVDDPQAIDRLLLRVDHDAGFVAWLNGHPVGAVRAPEPPLAADARALAEGPQAINRAALDLTPHRGRLRAGANLLALHALTADDDDLLVAPTLVAEAQVDGAWGYFPAPTPGAPNEGEAFDGWVSPVQVSRPAGWIDGPSGVSLGTATPEAEIRYTLDGRAPSAEEGLVYRERLTVEGSTVLRATAHRPGWLPAPVTTVTWLLADDVRAQTREAALARGFPPTWGDVDTDYAVDPRVVGPGDGFGGIYEAQWLDALHSVPALALSLPVDDLFAPDGIYTNSSRSGLAWERAASLELIQPPGADAEGFQVDCGLRIQGGAFRSHRLTLKHSLRVLFKGLYGPTKLEWPLLGDAATDRFDTLTLRANSNDGWQWSAARGQPLFIRDAFGRATMRAMGGVASHSAFFHLFLNGVYWGLYEATERPDAAFSATYLGGDKADWDGQNSGSAVDGDLVAWRALLDRLAAGVADLDSWFELQGLGAAGVPDPLLPRWVDMVNLADYMLTNLYVGNTDWPRKNFYLGRPRDGRLGFHFYMWDSEWSLGLRSNLQTDRTGVEVGVAQPWDALKTNPEFRLLVADRARRHLTTPGGALWVDPAAPAWDPQRPERNVPAARMAALAAAVERPLVMESARWGDQHRAEQPYTVEADWRAELQGLLADYFPQRSAVFLDQLRAAGLYPPVEPTAPDHWGGAVDAGHALSLTAPEGAAVVYTVDGGDPRLPGGEVSPAAVVGGRVTEVALEARGLGVQVQARARAGDGTWSALTALTFDVF